MATKEKKKGDKPSTDNQPTVRSYALATEAMEKVKQSGGTPEQQVKAFEVTLAHFSDPENLEMHDEYLEWQALVNKYKKKQA